MRLLFFIVGILLLIILGVVVFGRSGGPSKLAGGINLASYANNPNARIQYTLDGPINAAEIHQTIQITIDSQTRQLEVLKGYHDEVISSKTYPNDSTSFGQFLEALNRAGFTKVRNGVSSNFTAVCPLSNRTAYTITNGPKTVEKLWSAACVSGSYGGNIVLTQDLFQMQIPDYNSLTSNLNVYGSQSPSIL